MIDLDIKFVNDGFDLLELRSLVRVCVPADVDDPLEMVVDGAGDHWPGQLLCHLWPCVCVCVCVFQGEYLVPLGSSLVLTETSTGHGPQVPASRTARPSTHSNQKVS